MATTSGSPVNLGAPLPVLIKYNNMGNIVSSTAISGARTLDVKVDNFNNVYVCSMGYTDLKTDAYISAFDNALNCLWFDLSEKRMRVTFL